MTTVDCPICKHPTNGLRSYTRHVGRHLEQLALFALPDLEQDGWRSDEVDGSDSAASVLGVDSEPFEGHDGAVRADSPEAVAQQPESRKLHNDILAVPGVGNSLITEAADRAFRLLQSEEKFQTENPAVYSRDWDVTPDSNEMTREAIIQEAEEREKGLKKPVPVPLTRTPNSRPPPLGRWMERLSVDPNEEQYWNTSDKNQKYVDGGGVENNAVSESTSRPVSERMSDEKETMSGNEPTNAPSPATAQLHQIIDHAVQEGPQAFAQAIIAHPTIVAQRAYVEASVDRQPNRLIRSQLRQTFSAALIRAQFEQARRRREAQNNSADRSSKENAVALATVGFTRITDEDNERNKARIELPSFKSYNSNINVETLQRGERFTDEDMEKRDWSERSQ